MRPLVVAPVLLVSASAVAGPPSAALATTDSPARWLSLSVTSEPRRYDATRGARAELDLADVDGFMVGGVVAADQGTLGIYDGGMTAQLRTTDVKALVSIARAAQLHGWELRGTLAAGMVRTTATGDMTAAATTMPISGGGVFPTAEASARVTVPISPRWAVTAGPTATYYDQHFRFVNGTPGGETHRLGELVIAAGLSLRL